jgi:hypothetical protein
MNMIKFIKIGAVALMLLSYGNSALARYLQADPVGLAGGLNPYAYVNNNPLNLIDPQGLSTVSPEFGAGGSGGSGLDDGPGDLIGGNIGIGGLGSGLRYTPSPVLNNSPYNPSVVANRIRPPYLANPAHNPYSPSFNPRKTPEPPNVCEIYNSSVRGGMGTWYGNGGDGNIYRFFSDNAGSVHFSGSIPPSLVPSEILQLLGN